MSSQVQPRILSGFMELLPEDQIRFNQMVDIIRAGYEKFGFLPLDTPTIELSEVLLAKAGGETEKQIYRFQRGDNDLSLRFDLTVPLARYVSQHAAELTFPFKRYQIGKVFRGERPQKGRFREFYQCDIDIIGSDELDIVYDAEMPAVIYHVFKELAFGAFTIHLNNRKLLNGFFAALGLEEQAAEVLRIIDKLAKIGEENVVKELQEMQLTSEAIDAILQLIHIAGSNDQILDSLQQMGIQHPLFRAGAEELAQVIQYMRLLGVPEEAFHIDLTIARGLDYYTGTVYETTLNEYPNLGSVCSGGRYDNLTGYYTKQKMPGIGISIGLTRLFSQLKEVQVLQAGRKSLAEVLVVPMGTQQLPEALKAAQQLRQADIKTDVYYQQKGMKQKMKYAARLGVPYTMLIGEEEAQQQLVALKGMQQGTQELLSIEEAIVKINKA
ncbi:MAG: histidine--tRNA ligase [Lachnospiraceae bacterium]|nr:histidine--tRNA ligase [Lachnospiraceae bacterium]